MAGTYFRLFARAAPYAARDGAPQPRAARPGRAGRSRVRPYAKGGRSMQRAVVLMHRKGALRRGAVVQKMKFIAEEMLSF